MTSFPRVVRVFIWVCLSVCYKVSYADVSLNDALDSDMVFSTDGAELWVGVGQDSQLEGDHIIADLSMSKEAWIETEVQGPGVVGFRWSMDTGKSYSGRDALLTLSVNGRIQKTLEGWQNWQMGSVYVGDGTHLIRWTARGGIETSVSYMAGLNEMTFTPGFSPMADAFDLPMDTILASGGDVAWQVQRLVSWDGGAAIQGGPWGATRQSGWLTFPVMGPGTISFRVRSTDSVVLQLKQDGELLSNVSYWNDRWPYSPSNEREWYLMEFPIASGVRQLECIVEGFYDESPAFIWLDEFKMRPATTVAEGLDGLSPTMGGDAEWLGYTSTHTPDGEDAVAVALRQSQRLAWMETTITGPVDVRYYARASGGRFRVMMDGVDVFPTVNNEDANFGWERFVIGVPEGEHVLRWQLEANHSGMVDRFAFIDGMQIEPSGDPFRRVLSLPEGTHLHLPWESPFEILTDPGEVGIRNGPTQTSNWLTFRVPESGNLSFDWKVTDRASGSPFRLNGWNFAPLTFQSLSEEEGWKREEKVIPSNQFVRLDARSFPLAAGRLHVRNMLIDPPKSLSEALDTPLLFDSPDQGWVGINHTGAPDGTDFAITPRVTSESAPARLDTSVTGPGTLRFRWRGDVKLLIDGEESLATLGKYVSGRNARDWEQVSQWLGEGDHELVWLAPFEAAALDQVEFVSAPNSLVSALDLPPHTPFATNGDLWSTVTDFSYDDEDAAFGVGEDGEFRFEVEGPAVLSFRLHGHVIVDSGGSMTHRSGHQSDAWTLVEQIIPQGSRYVRFSRDHIRTGETWLDQLTIRPTVEPNEALNSAGSGLTFSSSEVHPWVGYPGTMGSVSPPMIDLGDGETWLQTTVSGPGTLRYRWRAPSKGLELVVNGEKRLAASQKGVWREVVKTFPEGDHTVQWVFNRDGFFRSPHLFVVDSITFETQDLPPLNDALELPNAFALVAEDTQPVESQRNETYDGIDALALGRGNQRLGHSLSLVLPGEGWLRYRLKMPLNFNLYTLVPGGYYDLNWQPSPGTDRAWQTEEVYIANSGMVGWSWTQGHEIYLDDVRYFRPHTGKTLSEAVGAPGWEFRTAPDYPWMGKSFADDSEVIDLVKSAVVPPGRESWIETTVEGPGMLEFKWKLIGDTNTVSLRAEMDGGNHIADATPGGWIWPACPEVRADVPAGDHTIRWTFHNRSSRLSPEAVSGWLASVAFHPDVLMAEALEFSESDSIVTKGWSVFERDEDENYDGEDSLKITETTGELSTAFAGPGLFQFRYRQAYDPRSFVNVRILREHSTFFQKRLPLTEPVSPEWRIFSIALPDGNYQTKIALERRISNSGFDAFWLDQMRLVPWSTIHEVNDSETLAFTTGGEVTWIGEKTVDAWDGQDLMRPRPVVTANSDATSWLGTSVAGPATLNFRWRDPRGRLRVTVNGLPVLSYRGADFDEWNEASIDLPQGDHEVRWHASVRRFDERSAELDAIELLDGPAIAHLIEVDGAIGHQPSQWKPDLSISHDGEDSLRSNGRNAVLEYTIPSEDRGTLQFWWRVSQDTLESPASALTLSLNELSPIELRETVDTQADTWQLFEQALPAGEKLITWSASETDAFWIDQVQFVPNESITLAESLETLAALKTGADQPWRGERSIDSAVDGDMAIAGPLDVGEESWLTTEFLGPGQLRFKWKQAGRADLSFEMNGHELATAVSNAWTDMVVWVPPGFHTVRWHVASPYPSGMAYVDGFNFTSDSTLPDSLELSPHIPIAARGGWLPSQDAYDGEDSIGTQIVSPGEADQIAVVLEGPGNFEFQYKVIDESTFGRSLIRLYVDGKLGWSSEVYGEFARCVYPLEEGTHQVLLSFERRFNQAPDTDSAWLDAIRYSRELDFSEALDTSLHFRTESPDAWRPHGDANSKDGLDMVTGIGSSSPLEATISGPGELRFWWKGRRNIWRINRIPLASTIEDGGWSEVVQSLPEGEFHLAWNGDYAISLDKFSFIPSGSAVDFEHWAALEGLEETDAAENADPNADGVTNLAAYGFGISPLGGEMLDSRGLGLPIGIVDQEANGDRLKIEFFRRKHSDIDYCPKFSGDLVEWDEDTDREEVTDLGDGWERVRVFDKVIVGEGGRRFGVVELRSNK